MFQRVNNFLSNQKQISLLADFVAHEEELCNVIRLFAEHCPIDEVKSKFSLILRT